MNWCQACRRYHVILTAPCNMADPLTLISELKKRNHRLKQAILRWRDASQNDPDEQRDAYTDMIDEALKEEVKP